MSERLEPSKFTTHAGDGCVHHANVQMKTHVLAGPRRAKSTHRHIGIRSVMTLSLKELDRAGSYFVDTEHIGLNKLDRFFNQCDAFTIDITDDIGKPPKPGVAEKFAQRHSELTGEIRIPDVATSFWVDKSSVLSIAEKFIGAIQAAGQIYRAIASKKGNEQFIPEIAMNKTDSPQTPIELLVVLAAIADERIPIQAIAPKLTGQLSRNTDYVQDVKRFAREFQDDTATIAFAVKRYDLPANLKLSVHSGSQITFERSNAQLLPKTLITA